MVAAPSDNDGFHTCRGGDTLDSFGPLTHRGQKPQTADQPAQWMQIASSFTTLTGEYTYTRMKVNEKDIVSESAGLMQFKPADPMKKSE